MNSPDPEDDTFLRRVASLPRPALRAAARQRSLEAALAALSDGSDRSDKSDSSDLPLKKPAARRRFPRISRLHLSSLAACWALAGYFHLSAPGAPENPGTSPAAGYSAWPGPFHPAPDEETAQLLATLYPGRAGEFPTFTRLP